MWTALALLLLAAGVPQALAQPVPAQASAVDPERRALARTLAETLNPREMVAAITERMIDRDLLPSLRASPNNLAVEQRHPGILAAMVAAMRPILLREATRDVETMWAALGDFYASRLDGVDLRAAIAFYGSPLGTKMVALMSEGVDLGPMLTKAAREESFSLEAADLGAVSRAGAAKAVGRLTPEEMQQAYRFGTSPSGRKLLALAPAMQKLTADFFNQSTPELDAELDRAITGVLARYGIEVP